MLVPIPELCAAYEQTIKPSRQNAVAAVDPSLPDEVKVAAANPKNDIGKFILIRLLGKGGMGEVYRPPGHQGIGPEGSAVLDATLGISRPDPPDGTYLGGEVPSSDRGLHQGPPAATVEGKPASFPGLIR